MNKMDIKQEIIKVCDDMVAFWEQFKVEMEAIPNEDEVDIICKWHDYFQENSDVVARLSMTKRNINEVEMSLIMNGKLKYIK